MVDNKFVSFSKLLVLAVICFASNCRCSNVSSSEPEFGNRILNGITAEDHQFPYQVSLQKKKRHVCGGSIISDVKVLTAGHCVTNDRGVLVQAASLRILAGTNNLNAKYSQKYYSVQKFSIHPKYNRATVEYDYAVIFINGNFDFEHEKMSIIALATQDPVPGTVCYLSGWGNVDTRVSKTIIPNELQYATITVDPAQACIDAFAPHFKSKQMLCAGRTNKENAGCGDSGG